MKADGGDSAATDGDPWFANQEQLLDGVRQSSWAPEKTPKIGGYTEFHELKRGGQGVVYRAIQRSTNQAVAVKVLLEGAFASEAERRRFEREIELVAGLRHSQIVRIYDSGVTSDDRMYFVMEYIEGRSLAEWALNHPSMRDILDLMAQVCDAVHYAQQRGVIHRDLKPSNILVDSRGEPHILDFGLAKAAGTKTSSGATSVTGEFVGSLPWASPEQASGQPGDVDIRTDVYSLGVILYQLLTGQFPYLVDGSIPEALEQILHADPLRPSRINRKINDDLETILLKCLQKSPDRRYHIAGEVAAEIRRYRAGDAIEAKRDSRWYLFKKTVRRHKFGFGVAAGFMVLVLVFGTTMGVLYNRASIAEKLTETERLKAQKAADRFAAVNEFLLGAFIPGGSEPGRGRELTVREGVDAAAARIDGEFPDQPELRADLHLAMGYWYGNLGEREVSERQHLASLASRREALGDRHPDVAGQLFNMGWGYVHWGELEKAEDFFRESLTTRRDVLPPGDPSYGWSAVSLGFIRLERGDPAEAEELLREGLRVVKKDEIPGKPEILYWETVLGACLGRLGRFDEAESYMTPAVKKIETVWGLDHPNTQRALQRIVDLYDQWGKPERAAIYRAKLGR